MKFRIYEGDPEGDGWGFYPQYRKGLFSWRGMSSGGNLFKSFKFGYKCGSIEQALQVIERAKKKKSPIIHDVPPKGALENLL